MIGTYAKRKPKPELTEVLKANDETERLKSDVSTKPEKSTQSDNPKRTMRVTTDVLIKILVTLSTLYI